MTPSSALIDIGGSSVKVTIFAGHSHRIYSHEVPIKTKIDARHVFIEPNHLFPLVIEAMNKCSVNLPIGLEIDKVYVSSLRQGFCLIMNENEITPIYLNSDTSGEEAKQYLEDYGSIRLYEETGHWFAPQLTLPKVISLMRRNSELIEVSTRLLFVHDWLVWKMTGVILTEMTLVSAGQFADIKNGNINIELLEHFEIPSSIIPAPSKVGTEISEFNSELLSNLNSHWQSAKLFVGGGDSHFLHMGATGNSEKKIVVSAGSSTPISLLSPTYGGATVFKPWISTSFMENIYFIEGNLGYPGSYYGWLKRNLSMPLSAKTLNIDFLSKAPMVFGSCNMWNEQKWDWRPAFSFLGNISECTGEELALGVALDYAFALESQISAFISDGFDIDQIIITGGGANEDIQKILNSLIDCPVEIMPSEIAIRNLFLTMSDEKDEGFEWGIPSEKLDQETSEFLKCQSVKHALMYEQVEGTRKVLENVR